MSGGDRCAITLRGLEVFGRHGVFSAERELGQRFVVDLELELASCEGAESDRLEDTVDYAALAADVERVVGGQPVALLERLAALIADAALTRPAVAAVVVTVRKPHLALAQRLEWAAVTLRRHR